MITELRLECLKLAIQRAPAISSVNVCELAQTMFEFVTEGKVPVVRPPEGRASLNGGHTSQPPMYMRPQGGTA